MLPHEIGVALTRSSFPITEGKQATANSNVPVSPIFQPSTEIEYCVPRTDVNVVSAS